MITVLLVEDELETREGIKKYIPWKETGIDLLYEAANGLEALDLCESIHPNILLTDVRMPKMDGVQLATYVRERFADCTIIFLSGFTDKHYLKSAIRLGALNYIEKPVELEELKAVLSEAVQLHQRESRKKEEELLLQSMVTENLPLIMQKLAIEASYENPEQRIATSLVQIGKRPPASCEWACSLIIKLHETAPLSEEEQEYYRSNLLHFLHRYKTEETGLAYLLPGFLDNDKLVIHCLSGQIASSAGY